MDGLIQQNSLLISLLAGNLVQRPVRNGLHRQPRSPVSVGHMLKHERISWSPFYGGDFFELSRARPLHEIAARVPMSAVTSRIQPSAVLKATTHRGSSTRYTVPSRLSASGSIAARWAMALTPVCAPGLPRLPCAVRRL